MGMNLKFNWLYIYNYKQQNYTSSCYEKKEKWWVDLVYENLQHKPATCTYTICK